MVGTLRTASNSTGSIQYRPSSRSLQHTSPSHIRNRWDQDLLGATGCIFKPKTKPRPRLPLFVTFLRSAHSGRGAGGGGQEKTGRACAQHRSFWRGFLDRRYLLDPRLRALWGLPKLRRRYLIGVLILSGSYIWDPSWGSPIFVNPHILVHSRLQQHFSPRAEIARTANPRAALHHDPTTPAWKHHLLYLGGGGVSEDGRWVTTPFWEDLGSCVALCTTQVASLDMMGRPQSGCKHEASRPESPELKTRNVHGSGLKQQLVKVLKALSRKLRKSTALAPWHQEKLAVRDQGTSSRASSPCL